MASQLRKPEETKGPQNPALKSHDRTGKSAEKQDSPPQENDPNNKKKTSWSIGGLWQKSKPGAEIEEGSGNKPKNLQKIGNYAKSLLKGWTDSLQNQLFVEPQHTTNTSNNTTQDSISQNKGGRVESNENNEGEEDEEFENEEEEEDDDEEGEEGDESEESEGYEEEEGSLDDEQEKEVAAPEVKSNKRHEEKRLSIDNFAIDDDESPPIQHASSGSLGEPEGEKKHKEENPDKPKKKTKKKGKGKKGKGKGKGKKNQGARPKQQSDNLVFEDVYVNKNYGYGSLFTEFHQYYFKGDYLDFESDEFFRAALINEKTAISNLLFNEKRYLNIQDQVFYVTKLETVDNYKLALVLESYPLSRLVRLDKVDKKKRLDISFYTEDSGQNIQREMVYEIRNYHKFLRVLNQNLQQVNSSYHLLSFNI